MSGPTFGSPLGAQLVDVYVHDPAASATSTTASFASRNYSLAGSAAWSRLIEVQGFGQRYVDAHGATQGNVAIGANAVVLKGVTIGRGAIVAAGSVVTRSVGPYEIWGGVPARKLRNRPDEVSPTMPMHEAVPG